MKITAIMPTRDRGDLIPLAIRSLLSQDWERNDLELVVVDDGDDNEAVGDILCDLLSGQGVELKYVRMSGAIENWQRRVGSKRNMACEAATGEIIAHWDDDDWSTPERLREQICLLNTSGKAVTGYSTMLYWDRQENQASLYTGQPNYALGTSLCFYREWWKAHRFPAASIGEDNHFVNESREANQLAAIPGEQKMVARIHGRNTSNANGPLKWPLVAINQIPDRFFRDIEAVSMQSEISA